MSHRLIRVIVCLGMAWAAMACSPDDEPTLSPTTDTAADGGESGDTSAQDTSSSPDVPSTEDTSPPEPDQQGPPPDTGTPDVDPPGPVGLVHGFFAIHLDPGGNPTLPDGTPDPARPLEYLDDLTSLVEAADVHDHKLTLMFTGQWAAHMVSPLCEVPPDGELPPGKYAYQNAIHESCLELIRAFEAHGHEIAIHHHHEASPASWDGFSNDPAHVTELGYLGTVDDLLAYVSALPVEGASSVQGATLEEYPQGEHFIRITSARGPVAYVNPQDRGDLASTPCSWEEDGNHVWRFRMRNANGPTIGDEISLAAEQLGGGDVAYTAGFVTHAKDVAPSLAPYEAILQQLHDLGITLQGLTTVATHYPYTDGDPATDTDHGCPPDEQLDMGGDDSGPPGPPGPPGGG